MQSYGRILSRGAARRDLHLERSLWKTEGTAERQGETREFKEATADVLVRDVQNGSKSMDGRRFCGKSQQALGEE